MCVCVCVCVCVCECTAAPAAGREWKVEKWARGANSRSSSDGRGACASRGRYRGSAQALLAGTHSQMSAQLLILYSHKSAHYQNKKFSKVSSLPHLPRCKASVQALRAGTNSQISTHHHISHSHKSADTDTRNSQMSAHSHTSHFRKSTHYRKRKFSKIAHYHVQAQISEKSAYYHISQSHKSAHYQDKKFSKISPLPNLPWPKEIASELTVENFPRRCAMRCNVLQRLLPLHCRNSQKSAYFQVYYSKKLQSWLLRIFSRRCAMRCNVLQRLLPLSGKRCRR